MEILKILSGPVIGAVIGYLTNYIAVKMLFRPLKPIKIWKFTLPFTPGIIPKRQKAMAGALGKAVGDKLLDSSEITAALTVDETSDAIAARLAGELTKFLSQDITIEERICSMVRQEDYQEKKETVAAFIANKASEALLSANVGQLIAEEGKKVIKEKTDSTILKNLVSDSLISAVTTPIEAHINAYVETDGVKVVEEYIHREIDKVVQLPLNKITSSFVDEEKLKGKFKSIYISTISNYGENMIKTVDFAKIVESKVIDMDVLELERLLLSVMKKELGLIVNLGALIGFILGLINLLF